MIVLSGKKIIINFEINEFDELMNESSSLKQKVKLLKEDQVIDVEYQGLKDVYNLVSEAERCYIFLFGKKNGVVSSIRNLNLPFDFNFYNEEINWFLIDEEKISKLNETKQKAGFSNFNLQKNDLFVKIYNQAKLFIKFIDEMNLLLNQRNIENGYIDRNFQLGDNFAKDIFLFKDYLDNKNYEEAEIVIIKIINDLKYELLAIKEYKENYFKIDFPEIERYILEEKEKIDLNSFFNTYVYKSILEINLYTFLNQLIYLKDDFLILCKNNFEKNEQKRLFNEEIISFYKYLDKKQIQQDKEVNYFLDENLTFNSLFSSTLKRFITYCKNDEIKQAETIIIKLHSSILSEINSIKNYKNNFFMIEYDLINNEKNLKILENNLNEHYYYFYEKYTDKSIFDINLNEFFSDFDILKMQFLDKQKEDLNKLHKEYPEIINIKNNLNNINDIISLSNFKNIKDFNIEITKINDIKILGVLLKNLCNDFVTLFCLKELTINNRNHTTTNYISFPIVQSNMDLNLFSDLNVIIGLVSKAIEIKYNQERYKKENLNFDVYYQTGNIFIYTKLVKCLDTLRYFYSKLDEGD